MKRRDGSTASDLTCEFGVLNISPPDRVDFAKPPHRGIRCNEAKGNPWFKRMLLSLCMLNHVRNNLLHTLCSLNLVKSVGNYPEHCQHLRLLQHLDHQYFATPAVELDR